MGPTPLVIPTGDAGPDLHRELPSVPLRMLTKWHAECPGCKNPTPVPVDTKKMERRLLWTRRHEYTGGTESMWAWGWTCPQCKLWFTGSPV